jgi:hypothetical protein
VRDAEARAVDRHEAIDLALQAFVEEELHAAQIAEPFFADIAHEGDAAWRLHVAHFVDPHVLQPEFAAWGQGPPRPAGLGRAWGRTTGRPGR